MKSITKRPSIWLVTALLFSFLPAGCLFSGHKKTAAKTQDAAAAPDKILYDRALNDYQHGRYTESRLSLQTLINSYPDSEFLAKAKLAVADSYYKEGGTEGLTQAVAEYKDFITFFPFLEEASYAQMQVAMAHYRMMEKADRDPTQARLAEQEFQTFLLKYPKSSLAPGANQRLREVQEILGSADFEVAHFYYLKGDYRAAAARLIEVTNRYPLFSESDRACWMLGDIYQRAARGSKNEQERARWRSQADNEYAELVREYPLSSFAPEAKRRLTEDSVKIPPPDPEALARAKYEEKFAHDHPGLIHRALGVMKSAPDVSTAAHSGAPDLNPPGEANSPQDVFQAASASTGSDSTGAVSTGQSVNVQTVSPESATPPPAPSTTTAAAPPADPSSTSSTSSSTPPDAVSPPASTTPSTATATDGAAQPASATTTATGQPTAAKPDAKKATGKKVDKSKESTSKRKRGLKKLIPW